MAANGIRLLTIFVTEPEALAQRFAERGFAAPRFGADLAAGYRLAFTRDPDGNQLELVAFRRGVGPDLSNRFQVGLTVSDAERARAFYGGVLGLPERPPVRIPDEVAPDTMQYQFVAGVSAIKLWAPRHERPTRSGAIRDALGIRYLSFAVRDVDAVHALLRVRGATILAPPLDRPTSRALLVADPDGNAIEFSAPQRPAERP
jgi:catechol 2,3-dioxygenase-like lactoylglutathione lyase family enzyme